MVTENIFAYLIEPSDIKGLSYDFTGLFQILPLYTCNQGLKYSSPYKLAVKLSASPSTAIYLATEASFIKFHFAL